MRRLLRAGFSLTEVCLALGIAAFCLVAIFSLLPIGLRGNLESARETVATGILSQLAADLAACPATTPRGQATTTALFQIPMPANPVTAEHTAGPYFFSESGYDGTEAKPGSQYRVEVTFLTNAGAQAATLVGLTASWPAAAPVPLGRVETLVALDRN